MPLKFNPLGDPFDQVVGESDFLPRSIVNGTFKESFNALVTYVAPNIIMSLEQSGTGDLTMQFSDGNTVLDCTPACTATLTAGSDASPQENFVYILQSDKILTVSTSEWPSAEHIKVSYFLVPSATHVDNDGCYINQNWNDHLSGTDEMGHLAHIAEHLRHGGSQYFSGIDPNGTDQGAGSSYFHYVGASESYFKSTAGVAYQLHKHSFPVFDTSGSDDVHVANWNADAYHEIQNLADIVADSGGNSLGNKHFNLFFFATANKGGEYAPIICKLPSGGYNTQVSAENDVDGYDDLTMPREFALESSVGVPICRMTLKWAGGTTTLTHISTVDLRTTGVTAGAGGSGATTSFADNQFELFDEGDVTKIVQFQASGITTGNTRTLTVQDKDYTIGDMSDVVDDTTPQLGGNLDVNGKSIVSVSGGDIAITPDTTGEIVLDSLKWPQADGTTGQVLKTDGSAQLSWTSASGGLSSPLVADLDFATYKAVAMACDNGATLPTSPSPVIGQWFRHTPTGRDILFQYDGSAWQPMMSFGTMVVYVHSTGTDASAKGTATGTDAFATIQYAIDTIPPTFGGNVTVHISNETASPAAVPTLLGKTAGGNFTVTFQGILDELDDLTCTTGSVAGGASTNVQGTAVRNAGTWTTNDRRDKLIRFTGGTAGNIGESRIVDSNTSTTVTCVSIWGAAPQSGDTFVMEDWGTTIDGTTVGPAFIVGAGQKNVVFNDIQFVTDYPTNDGWFPFETKTHTQVLFNRCKFAPTANPYYTFKAGAFSDVDFQTCMHEVYSGKRGLLTFELAQVRFEQSKMAVASGGTDGVKGFDIDGMSRLHFQEGSVCNGFKNTATSTGISFRYNSYVTAYTNLQGMVRITNCGQGTLVENGGQGHLISSVNIHYAGNTTDEKVTTSPASFGYS